MKRKEKRGIWVSLRMGRLWLSHDFLWEWFRRILFSVNEFIETKAKLHLILLGFSCNMVRNYSELGLINAVSLVGQSAPPEILQKLTYLVIRHPEVKRIDTVRAYTFGVLYFVEVGCSVSSLWLILKMIFILPIITTLFSFIWHTCNPTTMSHYYITQT